MIILSRLLLSSAAVAASQNLPEPPRLLWASQPVRPNSTLLVQGHFPLGRATRAVLKALPDGPEANVSAAQDWESDTALYFRVPASFPDYTGLRLTVRSGGGGGSAPAGAIEVNTPRIKWTQGDAGASATPGGFLRLFGSALAFGQAGANAQHAAGTYGDYQMLESELNHALRSHDHVVIAEAAARLAQLGKALSGAGALSGRQTTLALVPVRGAATGSPRAAVNLTATNATDVDAHFALPATMAPGEYSLVVRNPAGMAASLDVYVDQARPRVTTVHVIEPPAKPPPTVFSVAAFLPAGYPAGGLDMTSGEPANATLAVLSALGAARAAGGGTVKLPRGKWFVDGPPDVPGHTQLVGDATHLSSLYFYEDQLATAPGCKWSAWTPNSNCTDAHCYVTNCHMNGGAAGYVWSSAQQPWGIHNLTIYVTHYGHTHGHTRRTLPASACRTSGSERGPSLVAELARWPGYRRRTSPPRPGSRNESSTTFTAHSVATC